MKYTWILGTLTLLCANAWLTEAAEPVPWRLSTNEPSFFFSDHRTGASYYRFDPDGNYVLMAKEHMGVWPLLGGSWIQDTNGTVTLTATNVRMAGRAPDKIVPLSYKGQVFLVWPEKSYASNVAKVMERIDSGTNRLHVYNEFQIRELSSPTPPLSLTRLSIGNRRGNRETTDHRPCSRQDAKTQR